MNLYLLEQSENCGYDTYDSAVVAAPSEEIAKTLSPNNGEPFSDAHPLDYSGSWATSPDNVTAVLIGKASRGTKQGLILASFNAG